MYHPNFPLPAYIRDEPAIRRLLSAAARLRRQAHYDPRHRHKLLAIAEQIEDLCRRPSLSMDAGEAMRLDTVPNAAELPWSRRQAEA